MALPCPQCGAAMREVTAPATTGYMVVLDQCSSCGGIWCDRWELFPLSPGAARQLDALDREQLWKPGAPLDRPMQCPRCKARMHPFQDRMLPPDARIERCGHCDGMWLNRGELRKFKGGGAAPSTPAHGIAESELDRLARASRDLKSLPTVSNLSDVFDAQAAGSDAPDARSELGRAAAWLVARLLLRLLLGF